MQPCRGCLRSLACAPGARDRDRVILGGKAIDDGSEARDVTNLATFVNSWAQRGPDQG